jgi:hypothetical protein
MTDAAPIRHVAVVAIKYRGERFEIGDPLPELSEEEVTALADRVGPAAANAGRKGKPK